MNQEASTVAIDIKTGVSLTAKKKPVKKNKSLLI
jgi:hypothetical protein